MHVATSDGIAKFLLKPYVELSHTTGLKARDVRRAWAIVEQRKGEILDAWEKFFGP